MIGDIPSGSNVTNIAKWRAQDRRQTVPLFQPVPKKPGDLMLVGGEMVEVRG